MAIDKKVFEKYQLDIKQIKPLILETIVEVLGEKYRNVIESKLDNICIKSYMTYEHIEMYMQKKDVKFYKV